MNKVYKVVWSRVLHIFVVVSELTKNKQKKSSHIHTHASTAHLFGITKNNRYKINAVTITLLGLLLAHQPAYAITKQQCIDMGSSCALISSRADLVAALSSSGTATTLLLTQDIDYGGAGAVDIFQNQSNRKDIVIDGGGHSITFGLMAFQTRADRTNNPNWDNATLTFTNFSSINTTRTLTQDARFVSAQDATTRLTVVIENNGKLLNNKLVAFGTDSPSAPPNNDSVLRIGNNGPSVLNLGTFRQLATSSNIEMTGTLDLTIIPGAFPAVFWSNASPAVSKIRFTENADVKFHSSVVGNSNVRLTNGPANSASPDNATYSFFIDDGAKVDLNIPGQNVLGISNFGVKVGSYDPVTGFGKGAVLKLNNWSNTRGILNHQLSNLPSTNPTAAIFNGPTSDNDVIYNLDKGSVITVVDQELVAGILAQKSTGKGNIYIRSGAVISDGTDQISEGIGIAAETTTADATGDILVKNEGLILKAIGILQRISSTVGTAKLINEGVIKSSSAGVLLLSNISERVTMTVDNSNGVINAHSGSGIQVFNANIDLNLNGGEINAYGTAAAINVNSDNSGVHTITGTTFNINDSAMVFKPGSKSTFNLYDNIFNTTDGVLFTELLGINFLYGSRNNVANIYGMGFGIEKKFAGIDLSNAALTINASGAGSIGLYTHGDQNGDANIIVGEKTTINANAGSAVVFENDISQSLINNGEINGSVSMGNHDNTIVNNGSLYSLNSGSGSDTLTLNVGSVSRGIIDLGDGDNTINIYHGSYVNYIHTGSGNDVFNIMNLTATGTLTLGILNAGAGVNTLNFINSIRTLNRETRLSNFNNIGIDETSEITLVDSDNIDDDSQVTLKADTSQLRFADGYQGEFTGVLAGVGSATVEAGANVTLIHASPFFGEWIINHAGILNVSQNEQLGTGGGAVHLAGRLNLTGVSLFNKRLTGDGLLQVDANNQHFNFADNVGDAFRGVMDLSNGSFALTPSNANALSYATLRGSANSLISVTQDNVRVGQLNLNGSTLQFNQRGTISTDSLTVEDASQIQVSTEVFTEGNLLDLDQQGITSLVNSNNTLSASQLANLTLQDLAGNALANGTQLDYMQNGNRVAINSYNFALDSAPGLQLRHQLTQIDLQAGQTLTLSSFGAQDDTLSARLTGSGNLEIGADNSALTLVNSQNDYRGNTSVNGGVVNFAANNVLGNTDRLTIANGATLNLFGYSQLINSLSNAGRLNFAGGSLTLAAGGSSDHVDGLSGNGWLRLLGGDFVVNAANRTFTAQTTIASGASASLNAADALGDGDIELSGSLNLNVADSDFANRLSGNGQVNVNHQLSFTANNQAFTGTIQINQHSALTVSQSNQIGSANLALAMASSQLFFNQLQGNIANRLSGVTGAQVNINHASQLSFSGDNSAFAGQFNIDGSSSLTASQQQQLGSGSIDIANGGQLIFDQFAAGTPVTLSNRISGAGTWLLRNSQLDLSGNSKLANFSGLVELNGNAQMTLDALTLLNSALGFHIANSGDQLTIRSSSAFNFLYRLTGNGLLSVDTAGAAFNFAQSTGNAFSGEVQ
uniref:autotransporter outer membrane beta-barrel domain-containing protein n=1 Tax=Serratia microhaemolytica TaxID=2675110 RepID=UPI0023EA5BA8